jgi:hypothetical protein
MAARNRTTTRSKFTLPINRTTKPSGSKTRQNSEVIATKGINGNDVFTIELETITQRLLRLRENSGRSIRTLTGQLKDDFQALAYYVQLLYDSSEYEVLFAKIRSIFGDLPNLQPGTVGAYFGGCLNRNPQMGSCALTCVDAVPPPADNFRFCDTLVVWAVWNGRSFGITPINAGSITTENRSRAYIFVEVNNIAQFPGFNAQELAELQRLGITQVQFIHYTSDGRQYTRLTPSFVPLDSVLRRDGTSSGPNGPLEPNQTYHGVDHLLANGERSDPMMPNGVAANGMAINNFVTTSSQSSGTVLIIVLVVIFLALLLFFGWRSWSSTDAIITNPSMTTAVLPPRADSITTIDTFTSESYSSQMSGLGSLAPGNSAPFMPLL